MRQNRHFCSRAGFFHAKNNQYSKKKGNCEQEVNVSTKTHAGKKHFANIFEQTPHQKCGQHRRILLLLHSNQDGTSK
jgi:hypothetical protein